MGQLADITVGDKEAGKGISVFPEDRAHSKSEAEEVGETNGKIGVEEERDQSFSRLRMESLDSSQTGAPRWSIIFLAVALVGAGAFACLLMREMFLRGKNLSELAQAEQAKVGLQELVGQLRVEVARQRDEMAGLVTDLRQANAKAARVDAIRQDHQAELSRLKDLYESQLASLRRIVEVRDDIIGVFQSDLRAIRSLLERGAVGAIIPSPVDSFGTDAASRLETEMSIAGFRPPEGKVITVDREHRFIVVGLGPAEGAQIGRFIQIRQKGTPIGQGRIDRVYQNLSAVTVLSEDILERVEKGDQVFLTFS